MSNGGRGKVVVVCTWQCGSGMMGYTCVGVEVAVPKQPKHLRRHKPQLKQAQTTIAMGIKMGQVAKGYGGYADNLVEGLGKLAKFRKI